MCLALLLAMLSGALFLPPLPLTLPDGFGGSAAAMAKLILCLPTSILEQTKIYFYILLGRIFNDTYIIVL